MIMCSYKHPHLKTQPKNEDEGQGVMYNETRYVNHNFKHIYIRCMKKMRLLNKNRDIS